MRVGFTSKDPEKKSWKNRLPEFADYILLFFLLTGFLIVAKIGFELLKFLG